jgi:hypothetical protein
MSDAARNSLLAQRGLERTQAYARAHPGDLAAEQIAIREGSNPFGPLLEGLAETQDAATAAGMRFKVGGAFGNLRPSLVALTKAQAMNAARTGYDVVGDDKHGYTRQFGPPRLGY